MVEVAHPDRKEIARYLLSRGQGRSDAPIPPLAAKAGRGRARGIAFPPGLTPAPSPLDPAPSRTARLPRADVVVITWTADELAGLAQVLTPGVPPSQWHHYARRFDAYRPMIRPFAPAAAARRLGSYLPLRIGDRTVLAMKSELHLNQDGIATGRGTATLPVKDFFLQVMAETKASLVITVGTAGSVFEAFGLGDVIVTRGAKFRCQQEFRNEPYANSSYRSDWEVPTGRFDDAERLMATYAHHLAQPPVGPPTKSYDFSGPLMQPPPTNPTIRLDGRDMPAFHPMLTTDFFEFGTSANRLDRHGSAIEMGDAVLGLAAEGLDDPPDWLVVRNMSNPVINGDLPTKEFLLNEQTTWAVAYYAAYGRYTSILSGLVTWAVIADLDA